MTIQNRVVFVLDDDDSVRRGLSRLLRSAGYRVRTFVSAREFLASIPPICGPACLVLDVQMPELTGLDLQRRLQAVNATLPIVFITGYGDIPMSVRAMKDGAVDFLPKPVQDADLLRAVGQALEQAIRVHAERLEREVIERRADTLTPREREVMSLVVAGRLNKQIADELGTVEKTIKVHRARVMDKMQVHSLPDLVRVAERLGVALKPRH